MKKLHFFFLSLAGTLAIGCSSDDGNSKVPTETYDAEFGIVVMTDGQSTSGFVAPMESLPEDAFDITAVDNATQLAASRNGAKSYKGSVFMGYNAIGQNGIQKYNVSEEGKLVSDGFIVSSGEDYSTNYLIIDDNLGYYFDGGRGNLKLQKFDPSTMTRIGEIDLSMVSKKDENENIVLEKIGQRMLINKDGKLYADIQYDKDENGLGSSAYDAVFVAVIDIDSEEYLKTVTYEGAQEISYYTDNLNDYQIDAEGDLYINTMGNMLNADRNGKILRINKGEDEFDTSFEIAIDDYVSEPGIKWFLGGASRIGNDLITYIKATPFTPNYSNFVEENMVLHKIDIDTKVATKIEGAPINDFASINAPFVEDNLIWIPYSNSEGSGYYSYDGDKVTERLYLNSGVVQSLFKL
ncbi:hypothetical protein HX109_06075 [Galbibacter sp. BG1]|uniref:hypothetical protein n=1 Tax=Galbibacter sp. BG1 TaxID=1170699 RepID=UPI0015C07C66|nr:hypothetical protein [Galbibacter sp. BG1]QLE01151.1 hypothetical protein HX109_06075 [Galbibacter sp. BG1]